MEPRAWKKLLLKWVNECHFIENITSLEESDIEAFYAIYEQYANFEPGQNSSCLEPLQIFLKDIYADFTPIFDGEGRVATTDYVYVYTLLMHYTCVQKPNKYFHNICKNLPETVQQCIAEFFKQTVDGLQLTRDCLQQTIVNIQILNDIDEDSFLVPLVPQSSTPDRLTMHRNGNCSSSITSITPLPRDVTNRLSISLADSSNNKDSSSIVSATMENSSASLLQRERRSTMNEIQMCAPATPKTELLDQRTRELFGLRAQLETERYEKTVLEEQVLETESLIKKLTRENAEQKKQLLMLKATLANDNEDEHNYATNEFDNMKRRLMNELSKKEKILSEKSEQLQELRAEHDKLVGKFKVSEKQVLVCMDRINELEQRLNSSEQLLRERGDEMEHLAHDKLELERCLQEARNELQNGREVLNASSDLLDTSQLQSSMNTTPENLASSVIDKQLREKELENDQLRSVLELNSQEKERIESQLLQLVFKYKLEKSKETTPEKTAEKSQSHMLYIIEERMEQLTVKIEQEHQRANELQSQYNTMQQQNIVNNNYIQNLKSDVEKLNCELTASQADLKSTTEKMLQAEKEIQMRLNTELERSKQFSIQIADLECDLETQSQTLKQKHEQLEQDLLTVKASKLQVQEELQTKVNDFQKQLKELQQDLENSRKNCQKFEQIILDQKLSIIREKEIQMEQEAAAIAEITNKYRSEQMLLQQQLDLARQELENQKMEQTQVENELSTAKIKQAQLENEIHVNNLKITECETKHERELKQQSDIQRQQLEESEKKITDLQQQLKEGLKKIELRDEQLLDDRKLLDDRRNKCERLGIQLKEQEEDLKQKSDEQKQQLEESEKKITDLQQQLTEGLKKLKLRDEQLLDDRKLLDDQRNKCERLEIQLKEQDEDLKQKSDEQKQQLEESEKKITDLQNQLTEGMKKLEQRDEQLLQDRKLLDVERKKCEHLEYELKKHEDLKHKSDEQKQQLEESEKKIADLQQQLKEGLNKLAHHDEQLLDDRKLLDDERNKCERLETQLKKQEGDLKHKSDEQKQQLEESEKKIADLQQQLTEARDKLAQHDEQLLDDRKLLADERNKCERLETQLKKQEEDVKQKSEDQRQQLEESEKKIADLQQQLKEARDKLAHHDEQLLDDRKLLADERNKCERLETQLKKQEEDVKQKSEDQSQQLEESEKKIADLQQQLKEARDKHDKQLLDDRKLLDDERNKCERLETQLKKQEEDLKQKSEDQRQQLEESEKKIADLQQQLTERLKKLEQRDEQLLDDRKLLDVERKKCERLENQIKHLEAKHFVGEKDIKDTLAKKEEELEKIKTQLDLTTKRLEKMAVKLGEHQAVLSKKQREINQAKVGQDEQWDLLRTLQHEKESLQVELRQNKERVKRAEDKLINLEHQRCSDEAERVAKHDRMIELEKTCENLEMKRIELEQQLKITEQEKLRLSQEAEHRTNGIESASKQKDEEVKLCLKDVGVNTSDTLCAKPKVDCSAQTSFENDNNPFSSQIDVNTQNKLRVVELQLSEAMKELDHTRQAHKNVQSELDAGLAEIRISRETLQKTREQMTQENAKKQQLELDCQILQAKYRDSKEEIGRFEQKLKDQRLEMEGKLDKMKTKMRTLYMAEVTRMKEKQESDTTGVKAELEKVTAQNAKYEEHTRKLSNQIVRLNEKILDQQKQHALLSTKLRHLQEAQQAASEEWQPFKRPSAPSANLGSNLTMEDEEGEVFNNTYLTDLKTGRVPNITTEELQYRNSLQPPHLKSTYAAQYDVGVQEDDLKDCQLSLDDSMSALLTGNGGGANARKKSIGTHYKRPGPPTPSKNGGRMSFGSSEPPREVLRETYENGTAKTPARFKMFASRFSMGSSSTSGTGGGGGGGAGGGGGGGNFLPRDEQQPQHRQLWTVQSRKLHLASGSDGRFCTSTPRNVKRQLNYDRQRLILHDDANSASEHRQNANGTPHLSNAELLASTNRRRRRLVSTSSADSSSAASIRSNNVASQDQCIEKPRVTFCLHGNIFAKGRSRIKPSLTKATVAYRRLELQRKIREKRFGRFDQERHLELYDKADDSQEENTMSTLSEHNDNDNNANCIAEHNRNYSVVDVTCLFANLFLDDMDETEMVSEVEPKMESQTESETQSEIESETQSMLLPRTLPNAAITFNVETSTTNNSYWRWSPELRFHKRFWSRILLALVVLIAIGLRFLIDFN